MGKLGIPRKKNKALLIKPGNVDGVVDKKINKLAKNKKRKSVAKEVETMDIVDVCDEKKSGGVSEKKIKKKKRDKSRKDYVLQSDEVEVEDDSNRQSDSLDGAYSDKKLKKVSKNKKRKSTKQPEAEAETENVVTTTLVDVNESKNSAGRSDKKKNKPKKKRDKENRKKDGVRENVSHSNDVDQHIGKSKSASQIKMDATLLDDEDEVYQISSGDEDETTGMKRWITKYHRARPGAEILLENINDYLVDYWAQKEEDKKKREEEAADGGWTVVTHNKGRKKTTDAESGITVGSVAKLAVMDKMSKKKDNQVGLNFYRFQKREAQRSEIMMLQSKFEQDKKRIQQMRAARKFRPY